MENSSSWQIGKVAGAPVKVRPSALLLIVVFSTLYYSQFAYHASSSGFALLASVALALLLLASVFVHEVAHVLVARAFGVHAREIGLTFFGGHAGFTQEFRKPMHSLWVSLSGPLTNIALAFGFWAVASVIPEVHAYVLPYLVLSIAGTLNLYLGLFNLLPGLPLDGGNAVAALVWQVTNKHGTGIKVAARLGQVLCVAAVVVLVVIPLASGGEITSFSIIWTLLITWVLWSGARSALQQAQFLERVEKVSISDLVAPAVLATADQSIESITGALFAAGERSAILVLDGQNSEPVGFVHPAALAAVPNEDVSRATIRTVTVPLPKGSLVSATSSAQDLVSLVQGPSGPRPLFVLVDGERVAGVVWVAHLIRALNID